MAFEDELREQLQSLPVPDVTAEQIQAMQRKMTTLSQSAHRRRQRKRFASFASAAAVVVLIAGGVIAGYTHRLQPADHRPHPAKQPVTANDVQATFSPAAKLPTSGDPLAQTDALPTQRFLVRLQHWPKTPAPDVLMILASTDAANTVDITDTASTQDISSVSLYGQSLSWQNAINHYLQQHHLSKFQAQAIQVNASHGVGPQQGAFFVTAEASRKVNVKDWRLIMMDVKDTGSATTPSSSDLYQVKWAKIVRPQVSHSMAEAAKVALSAEGRNVQVLWQTTSGSRGFGLYQYKRGKTTYVTTLNGQEESEGYWDIPDIGPLAADAVAKRKLGSFDVISYGASFPNSMASYFVATGIATDKSAKNVKITFTDGVTKTVPVHHGAFGVLRTFSGTQGDHVNLSSAMVLGAHGQNLGSETMHVLPGK